MAGIGFVKSELDDSIYIRLEEDGALIILGRDGSELGRLAAQIEEHVKVTSGAIRDQITGDVRGIQRG